MTPDTDTVLRRLENDRVVKLNGAAGVPRSPFLKIEAVAERYGLSLRSIGEMTRRCEIPHRKLSGGSSPCLYLPAELEAWENGAEMIVTHKPNGGRVVRPKGSDV